MAGVVREISTRRKPLYQLIFFILLITAVPGLVALPRPVGPHDPVAYLMRMRQYDEAYEHLRRSTSATDSLHTVRMAVCLLHLGRAQQADSLLEQASAADFQRPYLLYWQGRARAAAGNHTEAAAAFRRVTTSSSGMIGDSAAVAFLREARRAGDTTAVEHAVVALVSRSNGIAVLGWHERMMIHLEQPDSAGWIDAWTNMLQRYPRSETTLRAADTAHANGWRPEGPWVAKLARMYERHGERSKALAVWQDALDAPYFAGRQTELHYRIAKVLLDLRRYRQASAELDLTLEDESDRTWKPHVLRLYAKLERRRNHETASRHWERRFVQEYPSRDGAADALWNIGMSLERVNRLNDAIDTYRELSRRYPRSDAAVKGSWRVGFCLYRQGEYSRAHREFSTLASTTRDFIIHDQAGYWAGKSLWQQGRQREALAAWDLAAAYSPRTYYAVLSAVRSGRPVVPPEDENPPPAPERRTVDTWPGYQEAWWLTSLGQLEWARTALITSSENEARSIDDKESLADALESIGDYAKAIRWRWRAMWSRTTADRYYQLSPGLLRRVWPGFFGEQVLACARENGVPPTLLWAIMRQESVFDPDITSRADARGLMQIIPPTGRALARDLRIRGFESDDLYRPDVNVRLGAYYVARLLRRFDNRIDLVAAAYNAGPGNAVRWDRDSGDDVDVLRESITYSETRKYVKLVLKNYYIYEELYPAFSSSPRLGYDRSGAGSPEEGGTP